MSLHSIIVSKYIQGGIYHLRLKVIEMELNYCFQQQMFITAAHYIKIITE